MKQLFKANEAKMRSLESEVKKFRTQNEKDKKTIYKAQDALETMAEELKMKGFLRKQMRELLGSLVEVINIDEIYDDELSINTEEDFKSDINQNIRDINKEFQDNQIELDELEQTQLQMDLDNMSSSAFNDSNQFYNDSHTEINTSNNNNNTIIKIENQDVNVSAEKDIFVRNSNSDISQTKSTRSKNLNKDDYRSQMEIEIENKIQSRINKSSTPKKTKNSAIKKSDVVNSSRQIIQPDVSTVLQGENTLMEEIKYQLTERCLALNLEHFEQLEIDHILMKIKMIKKVSNLFVWLFEFFENKITQIKGNWKKELTEKSINIIKRIY